MKRRDGGGRGNRERRKRKQVMIAWSSLLLALAVGALGVALFLWLKQNMSRRDTADGTDPMAIAAENRIASRFASPTEGVALALVKRALAVRDAGRVSEVFNVGSATPDEVVAFLEDLETHDGSVTGFSWLSSMDANGLLIDGVLVNTPKGNRLAMLTPDARGSWKIDFDAFARTARPSWSELLESDSGGGLVRVVVAADTYFNGPFRDDSKWVCYGMASPDHERVIFGYCQRGSAAAQALERIIPAPESGTPGRAPKRATLEIRRIEGAEARQFEISRVLAEDWVISDQPFDERFE